MPGLNAIDDLIRRLGKVNPAAIRKHAGIAFDPRDGIGGVPDAANIDYRGFQAYMHPSQFIGLNPPRDADRTISHIRDVVDSGGSIGTPMLYVDKTPGGWAVRGHEGRGRMQTFNGIDQSALYPVAVHPYGEVRARHLTPEDLFQRILPDNRGGAQGTRPDLVIWQQSPFVRPGQEENPAVLNALREMLPRGQ